MDERVLAPVIGSDEAEALLVAEPLHDTRSHRTAPRRSGMREGRHPPGGGPDAASCTSLQACCQPSPGASVPPAGPPVCGASWGSVSYWLGSKPWVPSLPGALGCSV